MCSVYTGLASNPSTAQGGACSWFWGLLWPEPASLVELVAQHSLLGPSAVSPCTTAFHSLMQSDDSKSGKRIRRVSSVERSGTMSVTLAGAATFL